MKQFLLIILLIIAIKGAFPQNVTNVQVEQIGKKVHITYTIDKSADITLHLSIDGGVTFSEPLMKVSGGVGKNIPAGIHTIVWDVLAEKENLKGEDIVFRVKAIPNSNTEKKKLFKHSNDKKTFFTLNYGYSIAPQSSYGFTIGKLKTIGWYISVMSNLNFQGLFNPFNDGVYRLTGNSSTTRISLTGGTLIKIWPPLSLQLGTGIGYRALNLETNDNIWFSYPQRTYFGIDASLGLAFHLKSMILTTQVITTNFKYLEVNIGLGWCF